MAEDKRKNNGGHSTKSKGVDKRKNQYRSAIDRANTVEDVEEILKTLKNEASTGDIPAIKLFLEYYLGKPTQPIEGDLPINLVTGVDIKKLFGE